MTHNGLYSNIFDPRNATNNTRGVVPSFGYGMPPAERDPNELTPPGEDNPNDPHKGRHGPGFREKDILVQSREDEFRRK